ncbi:hypothetical protein CHS0354_000618 [Potamilus streckersoni]|uniref:MORN repeat protein n=1 Tax=Potamilus streckersoni TaxID=2493646 RepID=A0AAE0T7X4_9BIVA|nr:hypothetical protein CHS0354_000618 [Potamilus streckersoni]
MKKSFLFFGFALLLTLCLGLWTFRELNSHKNGVIKEFFPDGTLRSETTYKNGIPYGTSLVFFKNGKLKKSVEFIDGKQSGMTITYYETGQVKSEEMYKANKMEGHSRFYNEDGTLQWEATYINDVKQMNTFRDYRKNRGN